MVSLSILQARRQRLDAVSIRHVSDAAAFLRTRPLPIRLRLAGTTGGVLLGAAASNVVTLLVADVPSHTSIVLTLGFGVAGTFLSVVSAAREG